MDRWRKRTAHQNCDGKPTPQDQLFFTIAEMNDWWSKATEEQKRKLFADNLCLTSIPAGLFDGNPTITDLTNVFKNCITPEYLTPGKKNMKYKS